MFGLNHCEAGGALSRAWGFPESLQHYIHMHHDAVSMEKDPTIYSVQTACRLAEALGYPECAWAPPVSCAAIEDAIPPRFRNHPAFTPQCLTAIAESGFAVINET